MRKRTVFIILIICAFTASIVSIYSSFAYDEAAHDLGESDANYNLVYSLRDENKKQITVASKSDIYVDLEVINSYDYTVKYGTYYYLVKPNNMPSGITVKVTEDSSSKAIETIESHKKKIISLKITNDSEDSVDLVVGTIVGFENGNIEELVSDGLILVK